MKKGKPEQIKVSNRFTKLTTPSPSTHEEGKFTGGKWQVSKDGNDIEAYYGEGNVTGICAMYAYEKGNDDARLLAEAKNMYLALEEITEMALKWSVKGTTPTIHKCQSILNRIKKH